MPQKIGTLEHPAQYDLNILLAILARFRYRLFSITQDEAFWRIIAQGDALGLVRVSPNDDIHLMAQQGDFRAGAAVKAIHHILGAGDELAAFYQFAAQDELLWTIIKPLVGLPLLRTETVFEALVSLIIEQHISWVGAQRAQHQLALWSGRIIQYEGNTFYAFPTPQQLANARLDDLKLLKITFKRIQLFITLAAQITTGELNIEDLATYPVRDAYHALLKIKGVGHWTAANVAARGMGHYDYVMDNDVALQAAVNHYFYGETGRSSRQVLIDTFERYVPYAGLAAHFTLMRWVLDRYEVSN